MAKSTVVILNYNGRDFLLRFLPTLIRFTPNADLLVADNASTDDSMQVLANFPDIQVIRLPANLGYAGGYNEALKQVNSEYLVLLNSDVEVTEDWLTTLENFLDRHNEFAAVQPKLLDFTRRDHFEYAGGSGGFLDSLGYPFCRGRIFDTLEKDTGQYDQTLEIYWSSGACFMIRASAFWEVEGFDPDFFAHMEEIDLCWRLHSHGHRIACVPDSRVYHVGGGTLNKTHPEKTYLNFRNNLALLLKNMPLTTLAVVLPVRVVLDFIAALKFITEPNPGHFSAVLRAQKDTFTHFGRNFRKRSSTSNIRTPSGKLIFLVLAYFIRRRKTFQEINNTR